MQQHLTHLALEPRKARERRYERRLQALEVLVQPRRDQATSPSLTLTRDQQIRQEEGLPKVRRLQQALLRARSRVIPLIEYGASGSYVVICPQEGELSFVPDSPEWFDWLATLSSFHFVEQQGRLTSYREINRGRPTRSWTAHRCFHKHHYRYWLGGSFRLTIASLEQTGARLQADVDAL